MPAKAFLESAQSPHCTSVTASRRYSPSSIVLNMTHLLHFSCLIVSLQLTVGDWIALARGVLLGSSRRPFRLAVDLQCLIDGSRLSGPETTASIYRNASSRRSSVDQTPKCQRDPIFGWGSSTGDGKRRDITASWGRSSRRTTSVSLHWARILPLSIAVCSLWSPDTCRCCRVWSASSASRIYWLSSIGRRLPIHSY